jgi:hypothetical protein
VRTRRLQPRHAAYAALLVVVAVCVVMLTQRSATTGTDLDGGTIERLIPTPDAKVLQQDTIGIDLAPGHEGVLSLDGVPIPEDQLLVVPALNQVTFTPGPGKDYEQLPAGEHCLTARYWRSDTGPQQSTLRSWCFTVV